MIFWFIIFGISLLGIIILLTIKSFKPDFSIGENNSVLKPSLQKRALNVKNNLSRHTRKAGNSLGKIVVLAYNKGTSFVKETKVSNLVSGKGSLNGVETSSSFLKDIKETRDRVREDFVDPEDKSID